MKIRCIAVDDEPLALRQLETFIKSVPYMSLVAGCKNAAEAERILDKEPVDAMFCDINMPGLNGMDFVKGLAVPPLIVFTTAYSEYAVEGYKVDAIDYLLKPFGREDFMRATEKIRRRMAAAGQMSSVAATVGTDMPNSAGDNLSAKENTHKGNIRQINETTNSLFIKSEGRMVRIALNEIIYAEGMSEYVKLHLKAGDNEKKEHSVITLYSMKKLEERLPGTFMRIHRSYIINLKCIGEVSRSRVTLNNGTVLPIGDLYKDRLTEYLTDNYIGK